jgi:hypothetical protein
MMDYNATKSALSPCQISKVMFNMSREGTSQRNILDPRWCTFDPGKTISINEEIHWHSPRDLEGDLIIGNNATLYIYCTVSMPKGSKVTVKPGGTLVLQGGEITNLCGDNWEGIEIYKSKNKKGTVIVNNGSLNNMIHKVEVISPD